MTRKIIKLIILGVLYSSNWCYAQEIWVGKDGNIRNVEARAMIIDHGDIYLATKDSLYRAKDVKDKWESIFALPAGENEIKCLDGRTKNIFVGTKKGLFRTQDCGRNWRSAFRTILPEKNNILCVELSKTNVKKVFIGTGKGIFVSEDSGDSWRDVSANLKNRPARYIALTEDGIYAGGDDGLYFKQEGALGWERGYVHSAGLDGASEEPIEIADPEEAEDGGIRCIAVNGKRLYIGVGKRILYSDDMRLGWQSFNCDGLAGRINHILTSSTDKLYCATTKGVFEFAPDKGRWLELYKGMDKVFNVSRLICEEKGGAILWALTDNGVYRLEGGRYQQDQYIDIEKNLKSLKIIFDNEPAFKELRQAALRFAEVDPEKIRNWRREARLRALLPKVSFGIDKNRSSNSEIYTSATKDYIVVGPDDERSGYDISISWELADLIWSDDQTNIDVRSRLTTQLRNDILDDLRRVYFERKRLQFELAQAPPKDMNTRFEKETRIQELSQAIDDLTGNYLSEHSKPR